MGWGFIRASFRFLCRYRCFLCRYRSGEIICSKHELTRVARCNTPRRASEVASIVQIDERVPQDAHAYRRLSPSCSPTERGRRPISCARSRGGLAAASCSTSTTCSSAPSITASTLIAISPIFRLSGERNPSRGLRRGYRRCGLPLLIDARNSPFRDAAWSRYAAAIRRLGATPG
jgi:hypothetical protein